AQHVGPLTHKSPISPATAAFPDSSSSFTLYPGVGLPEVPYATTPGTFEMKMCSISVDPIPSRMSTPVRSFLARHNSAGNASPSDTQKRKLCSPRPGNSLDCSNAANSVGTPKKIVGRCSRKIRLTTSGVGFWQDKTALAQTYRGNDKLFPS